jgi:hypothetical protein
VSGDRTLCLSVPVVRPRLGPTTERIADTFSPRWDSLSSLSSSITPADGGRRKQRIKGRERVRTVGGVKRLPGTKVRWSRTAAPGFRHGASNHSLNSIGVSDSPCEFALEAITPPNATGEREAKQPHESS